MSEDMSHLIDQINQMIENNQIPENVKNMVGQLKQNANASENANASTNTSTNTNTKEKNSSSDFDIETMMKMKKVIDAMNSNQDDPRANLLRSLKPYLKESRKNKVDQYIQIFKMGKVLETFGPLGGEKKDDI